ncbi:MAG: hypothetical protein ABI947_28780 [Chloroflexota bacterium]
MNKRLSDKIEKLRADYNQQTGRPFAFFHCPLLFLDEDVELCEAHIVNKDFNESASTQTTVQRKDIDNFYGGHFEAGYVETRKLKTGDPDKIVVDKSLATIFEYKFLVGGEPVGHYYISEKDIAKIPKEFTLLKTEDGKYIVVKAPSEDIKRLGLEDSGDHDFRLEALVSLIKAAHLTLFAKLGYEYALSSGAHFVGRKILGDFFLQNRDKSKNEVLINAQAFFKEYTHMARPVASVNGDFQGTINDGIHYVCKGKGQIPWAHIVLVKTASFLNSSPLNMVIIPILGGAEAAARFFDFLRDDNEYIETDLCRLEKDGLKTVQKSIELTWLK